MKYLLGIVFSLVLVSPTLAWDKSPARILVWTEVCEEFYQPIYGMIERPASSAEVFTGFLIGGAVGNQFGGGKGKDAATALGAIIGSNIGANTNQPSRPTTTTVCQDVPQYREVQVVTGYRVKYRFNGAVYTTKYNKDPGSYVTIQTQTTHSVKK